jgi:hypothetical protein
MSLDELNITTEMMEVPIKLGTSVPSVNLTAVPAADVIVLGSSNVGPQGPPGPQGQWTALTQVQYDALVSPDPETLYVIVG